MPTNGQFTDLSTLPASDINTLLSRGYSNRIINGAFVINQRGYTSGTNLATGVYGFDRWRSGFTNTALTFTAGSQSTLVTISTSGVLQQIVERENMPAGTYTLSWTGTATGRINNVGATPGPYAASPIIVTLDGSANVVVEFTAAGGTRTLGTVQLEGGNVFSPFEYRHRSQELALCQRYFFQIPPAALFSVQMFGFQQGTGVSFFDFYPPVPFRVFPHTLTAAGMRVSDLTSGGVVIFVLTLNTGASLNCNFIHFTATHPSFGAQFRPIAITNDNNANAFIGLSAEL